MIFNYIRVVSGADNLYVNENCLVYACHRGIRIENVAAIRSLITPIIVLLSKALLTAFNYFKYLKFVCKCFCNKNVRKFLFLIFSLRHNI